MSAKGLKALVFSVSLGTLAVSSLAVAQQAGPPSPPKTGYKAPLAADGHPDLQGNWTTATITPLTRDPKLGDRNVLTKQEADALEKATQEQIARADAPTPPNATVKDLKNADCGADCSSK